jgi:hypothetical protein
MRRKHTQIHRSSYQEAKMQSKNVTATKHQTFETLEHSLREQGFVVDHFVAVYIDTDELDVLHFDKTANGVWDHDLGYPNDSQGWDNLTAFGCES